MRHAASFGKGFPNRLPVSGDTLVLAGLLLLFAGLSFAITTLNVPPPPGNSDSRSTFSAEQAGWKAFYRLLEERHNKTVRIHRRPREWPKNAGIMVTGPSPTGGAADVWSAAEAADALSWVSDGGVLAAFTDSPDDLTDALGLRPSGQVLPKPYGANDTSSRADTATAKRVRSPVLRRQRVRERPPNTRLSVNQPALFLEGVADLKVSGRKRYSAAPVGSITLCGDRLPLVVAVSYGEGMILAVADPAIPDNRHLTQGYNARFVTQMAEAFASKERPVIAFDEYHQGYREPSTLWTAIGRHGQLAFWQFAGLCLLMAYSASRRFGLPRPLAHSSRVSGEYVAALAGLYRRAHASDAALEAVLKSFWGDLCHAAGLPPDAPLPEAAHRVAGRATASSDSDRAALADRIIAVVSECRAESETAEPLEPAEYRKTTGKISRQRRQNRALSEAELLRLVTSLETLRKELELGGRNHV